MAEVVDRLGYDTLWLAEHHFQHEGYECIPNIPMLAVHLAHHTQRVKIGCAFNIVPCWNPLRLAEDYAMADILTKGRVVFGVGRGYHSREVETFGSPMLDAEANRELFEEQVEVMLKAFGRESFAHAGKHYTIPPDVPYRGYRLKEITLVPRPVHPVEVWQPIVSGSARSLDFMARHGIKGVISATAEQTVERWIADYRDAAARHGRTLALGEDLILGFRMSLADSVEQAIDSARPWFEEHAKFMAPLGMLRYGEEMVSAVAARQAQSPTAASLENGVRNRAWLCGPPRDVVAYLTELEARYPGLEHVMIAWALSTPRAVMLEQLTRFAREVMPAFGVKSG
jgi:alkanesulfonate monooxygenase SsuD/methylene tetrahydromethanopterin reductase-like flavin-dependent oxidoreductase (luciferase family)